MQRVHGFDVIVSVVVGAFHDLVVLRKLFFGLLSIFFLMNVKL